MDQPRSTDVRDTVRSHHTSARHGARHDIWRPDADVVPEHGVERASRPLRLRPVLAAEYRRSDDAEPLRSRHGSHQRRAAAVRRPEADSHDRESDAHPLQPLAPRRRSRAENRDPVRARRARSAGHHSGRRSLHRQQWSAVPVGVRDAVDQRRPLQHARAVCQRHGDRRPAADAQSRSAVRSQRGDQPGPARDRRGGQPDQPDRQGTRHAVHVECGLAAPRPRRTSHVRRTHDSPRELRAFQSGRVDRRDQPDPSGSHADDHKGVRPGNGRLHPARVRRRSARQPQDRSVHADAAHRRVLGRRRS